MKALELQSDVVYGPLYSRRFGVSLGINLLPTDDRVCSFDCVYCQYRGGHGKLGFSRIADLKPVLEREFNRLSGEKPDMDWIMFSGNGEPTLHPDFADLTDEVIRSRDRHLPHVPIGILSNSSTCHRPEIAKALEKLDGRFMKLDAGSLYLFHDVNRPASPLAWDEIIAGLSRLRNITIQSMFIMGKADNTVDRAITDWIGHLKRIRPGEVHIYTIDRQPQDEDVLPASDEILQHISRRLLKEAGIPSLVIGHATT